MRRLLPKRRIAGSARLIPEPSASAAPRRLPNSARRPFRSVRRAGCSETEPDGIWNYLAAACRASWRVGRGVAENYRAFARDALGRSSIYLNGT